MTPRCTTTDCYCGAAEAGEPCFPLKPEVQSPHIDGIVWPPKHNGRRMKRPNAPVAATHDENPYCVTFGCLPQGESPPAPYEVPTPLYEHRPDAILNVKKIAANVPISMEEWIDAGGEPPEGYHAPVILKPALRYRLRAWWWGVREAVGHWICGHSHEDDEW